MRSTSRFPHVRLAGPALVVLAAALGCAEGESFADAGPEVGLPFCEPRCDGAPPPPPLMLEMAPPPPPPQDMGAPPPPDMMVIDPNGECDPGTRIGPCALCDIDGTPVVPDEDPTCPDITCPEGEIYTRETEGEEDVCYVTRREAPGGDCIMLGQCHTDASTYCGEPATEEVARVAVSACSAMAGCSGVTPPEVEGNTIGQDCNTYGICNVEGECTAPPECADAQLFNRSAYCQANTEPGQIWCQFHVEQGGPTTCNQFCASFDTICLQAWNNAGDQICVIGNNGNCGESWDSFICRCGI